MSDELAQEEEDAEDYDLEAIQMRGERAKMEAMMGIDAMGQDTREGRIALRGDDADDDGDTVFEIGDEGSDDEGEGGRRKSKEGENERKGLMSKGDRED